MRILLPLIALFAATACSDETPLAEAPTSVPDKLADQTVVQTEPQLPGTSELKAALIGRCPKTAMRLQQASCTEAEEGKEFACTYTLNVDDDEHNATIAPQGEDWTLVGDPEECTAAG